MPFTPAPKSRYLRAAEGCFYDGLAERRAVLSAEIAGLAPEASAEHCALAANIIDGFVRLEAAVWFDDYESLSTKVSVRRLIEAYAAAYGEPATEAPVQASSQKAA